MKIIDDSGITKLIIENTKYLYNFAYRLTGSKESAEDLVQELFVTLSPDNMNIDHVRQPRAWLATILYRLFVKHWRKDKRSPFVAVTGDFNTRNQDVASFDPVDNAIDLSPGPQDSLQQAQLKDTLTDALDKLSDDHRVLVTLHDAEGYTLPELEEIMGVPLGTLKSRLHRARDKLEKLLRKKELL